MRVEYRTGIQEHLRYIDPQEHDKLDAVEFLKPEYKTVLEGGFFLTAWAGSRCLGGAGVIEIWPGRGIAWSVLSREAGPYMLQLTRKVRQAVDLHPCRRIEMTVLYDHGEGHKWARLLGFQIEAERMRAYTINGDDVALYARVK